MNRFSSNQSFVIRVLFGFIMFHLNQFIHKTLLKEAFKRRRFDHPNRKTSEIYDVLQRLKKYRCVCVPTEKTNSTRVIKIEDYKRWVSDQLLKAADLAICPKLMALFEDANILLEKVRMELSVKEE